MTFVDIVPFLQKLVKDRPEQPLNREIVLHPTCSTQKMDEVPAMIELAQKCATEVHVPEDFGCCGFAGDRGMLIPELTASATRPEAENVKKLTSGIMGISSSRTCEIGMMTATGIDYESIAVLVRDYLTQIK